MLAYQAERMPEQIRLKVGGVTSTQFSVYEEFARNIPGFQPMNERDAAVFMPKATAPVCTTFKLYSCLYVFYPFLFL